MFFAYSLLMGLAALLLLPYWLIQGLRHGKYLSNLSQQSRRWFRILKGIYYHHAVVADDESSVAARFPLVVDDGGPNAVADLL